jgi:hypothetical protein
VFTGQAHPEGSWEDVVWGDYWETRQTRAVQLLAFAGRNPDRHRYIETASEILARIVSENPAVPPHVLKNLAISLGRAGLQTADDRKRAADAWRAYLAVAPAADPQLPDIKRELQHLSQ